MQTTFELLLAPRKFYRVSDTTAVGEPVCVPVNVKPTKGLLEESGRQFARALAYGSGDGADNEEFLHGIIKELRRISGK